MSLCADFPRHARSRGQSTCQAAYTLRISVCRATLLREISEPFEKWTTARTTRQISMPLEYWSGRQDSNLRPLAPHASALPGCATPRPRPRMIAQLGLKILNAASDQQPSRNYSCTGESSV